MQEVALFSGIGEAESLLDSSGPLCGPESKKRGGLEMRRARIVEEGGGYYHVMSRIVDRRMVIDDGEKGTSRRVMRGMEGFSGVEIVPYAILDNHFHILFKRHRDHFGAKRKTGARPMSGAQWSGLCTARRLRREVIATPRAG